MFFVFVYNKKQKTDKIGKNKQDNKMKQK